MTLLFRFSFCLAALFMAAMPLNLAQAQSDEGIELTEADEAALQLALSRGQAIYNYDKAAWLATDAMLEAIADPGAEGLRGWIVEQEAAGWRVTFYKQLDDGYAGVFEGVFDGKELIGSGRVPAERAKLNADQILLVEARAAVENVGIQRCSDQRLNHVVMPSGKDDGSLFVYYLVSQPDASSVEMGGHHRFEIRDGKQVAMRKFTNSCLSMGFGENEAGGRPEALVVTHLLDPVPTEIHVFNTLAARTPIYVSTTENKHLWAIEISDGQARARRLK